MVKKKSISRKISNNKNNKVYNKDIYNAKRDFSYGPLYEAEERPIDREEIEGVYKEVYRQLQRYDERALDRVQDARDRFYAGIDPRRRQEVAEGGMVQEDENAIANLSPEPIHREYSMQHFYSNPYLDDLSWGKKKFRGY